MSKVRNLPETTTLAPEDLIYAVDVSVGANAGRKATVQTLKEAVIANAGEIPYDNTNSTLTSTDVRDAIDELDDKVNDHSNRHAPDGVDALAVGAPVTSTADGNNNIGSANSYSRSDHKHNIATAAPVSQTPDQASSAGVSTSLAKADHVHNIPAGTPSATFEPSTANAKGVAASFALSDHTHAHSMGLDADVSTILPNDTAATGTTDKFARAGHKHGIATAAAVSISTSSTNTEGNATSFARSNHTHAVSLPTLEATATADDNTSSLTDVLMVSMTLTPAAGTYLGVFGGSVVNSANGAERTWVSMYVGGTQLTGCERSIGTSGGAYVPVTLQCPFTVNGSQAVEIRWRVAGGTSTVHGRKLAVVKLG